MEDLHRLPKMPAFDTGMTPSEREGWSRLVAHLASHLFRAAEAIRNNEDNVAADELANFGVEQRLLVPLGTMLVHHALGLRLGGAAPAESAEFPEFTHPEDEKNAGGGGQLECHTNRFQSTRRKK